MRRRSTLGGIAFPFVPDAGVRLLAVEPSSCPTLTHGRFEYDFGDTAGLTPLLPRCTPRPRLRAAVHTCRGLRYHGASPLISALVRDLLGRRCAGRADQHPHGAVSGSGAAAVVPVAVSTRKPSRIQYSIPPIISLTR